MTFGHAARAEIGNSADAGRRGLVNALTAPLEGKLVAFFHQSTDLYGSDKILLYLAEGVQRAGGQAVVLVPDSGLLNGELRARGIEVHAMPILKLSRARYRAAGLCRLVCETVSALPDYDRVFGHRRVDLVHSNTLAVMGGALWARRRRIPHLWHVHEIVEEPRVAALAFPLMLRTLADKVVCNSDATYRWLINAHPALGKKMTVIRNGVDAPCHADAATIAALRRRFLPGGATRAVGLVGRINRRKGHQLLMDAVDLLHSANVMDFSVVFVGSAAPGQEHFEEELKQRILRSPLRDRIFMQGFTKEVWSAYAALDILCAPSTESESFGLVVAEAMAGGTAVIASRLGAFTELIVDGSTGLTVTPGDPVALAEALRTLLNDDAMRSRMVQEARKRVKCEFAIDRMIERFVATYAEMMGYRARSAGQPDLGARSFQLHTRTGIGEKADAES